MRSVSYSPAMAEVRVGTCSWADEALSKYFYPQGLPSGERLAHYAREFDTVEVDSTYYRLPADQMVERWAERTPDGFVMHVKAFALMTRHPVKLEQLPTDLRDDAPTDDKGRVERPSREVARRGRARRHVALPRGPRRDPRGRRRAADRGREERHRDRARADISD